MIPFTDNATNLQFLDFIEGLYASHAEPVAIKKAVLNYGIFNSRPMPAFEFGRFAKLARQVLARLHEVRVDVRRTVPEFLWLGGAFPQSQLAKCVTLEHEAYVFLDVVGPNTVELELLDSLLHEAVHATGPLLGRWHAYDQPTPEYRTHRMGEAYLFEEAVAISGAAKAMAALGAREPYCASEMAQIVQRMLGQYGGEGMRLSHSAIEERSNEATGFLLRPSGIRASVGRKIRELIAV